MPSHDLLRAASPAASRPHIADDDRVHITIARTDAERDAAFDVMVQLRPWLTRPGFAAQVRRQESQGFRLAVLRDAGTVRAVAGFRVEDRLFGRVLYVDDLITDAEVRSHGHGARLLDFLADHGRRHDAERLELDSGVQRKRAHRFYRRYGMVQRSLHFTLPLGPESDRRVPDVPDGVVGAGYQRGLEAARQRLITYRGLL